MSGENQIIIKIPKERISQLKNEIVSVIQKLDNFGSFKHDINLIMKICNYVENAKCIRKSKRKIDKKNLVIEIFDQAFTLDPDSKNTINSTIDHLHDDGKIKLESSIKWLAKGLLDIIIKKII
jgi:hypothetical protein